MAGITQNKQMPYFHCGLIVAQSSLMFQTTFLQLLDQHFSSSNKLQKIFKRNNAQVTYCCTQNVANLPNHTARNWLILTTIIHSHATSERQIVLWKENAELKIIYKCIVPTFGHPDKPYLGRAEEDQKKRYNQINSFKNKAQIYKTALAKYIWELKQRHNIKPTLKWYIAIY